MGSPSFKFVRNLALTSGVLRALRPKPRSAADREEDDRADGRIMSHVLVGLLLPFRFAFGTVVRLLPLLAILAAYLGGAAWAPAQAGTDYFSAAAQVIPVLLLALAVESRLLRVDSVVELRQRRLFPDEWYEVVLGGNRRQVARARRFDAAFGWFRAGQTAITSVVLAAGVVVVLVLAEWDCLKTLATIGSGKRDPAEVSAGILAGLVGVGLIALIGPRVETKALARLEDAAWAHVIDRLTGRAMTGIEREDA